jgi:hypothetical protein
MASFPPPTGRPANMFPRPDPWTEQVRRQEQHRAEQWRRRRKWLIPVVVLVVVAAGVIAGFLVNEAVVERRAAEPASTAATIPPTVLDTGGPEPTVLPDQLVEIDQVWLIDRGDGVFDWGVSLRTPLSAPTRSGVVVEVRLLDDNDVVVEDAFGVVDGIGPQSLGAVAGRLTDVDGMPVRLEFDVAVGVESNDRALGDVLDVRALERDSESVRGRIRSAASDPIDDVTMVLLWFDAEGEVVAAVPQPVEQVRPDVDARFDIDLSNEVVPQGRPDAVIWTR